MIRLKNVSKYYGFGAERWAVLQNLSLHIPQGKIFGIIGPSGAGKSTLLRTFNQLETIDSGELWVQQEPLHKLKRERPRLGQNIGMVFQQFNLLSCRTVYENILLPLELQHQSVKAAQPYLEQLLVLTELAPHRNKYPSKLSGGQQQRVAIARSLACHPQLLLCDEATSALDPQTSQAILLLIKKLHQELDLTVVMITHDLEVIKTICEEVALLEHGQLTEKNQVYRFFSQPQSATAKQWVHHHFGVDIPQDLELSQTPTQQLLVRLTYTDHPAQQPIISQLVKQLPLEINILRGNIDTIQGHTIGVLLITLLGDDLARKQGIAFLEARQVQVEVLSYVA